MSDIQLTTENRKSINNGINEWINSKTRASAESELQKEIIEKIHTETGLDKKLIKNSRKPEGKLGHEILDRMNKSHETMARWGVSHFNIDETDKILDIGCGGGKNLERFAKQIGKDGCVVGIDYSEVSVEKSTDLNKQAIDDGKVKVLQGSVSEMPFEDESFDIVTGFETIYFWPDFINDLKDTDETN